MQDFPLAIIGGTGLDQFDELEILEQQWLETPYGEPSAPLTLARLAGQPVIFLPRHGDQHTVPPHLINYRANLYALQQMGVEQIIAVNAVGGIGDDCGPGVLSVPDQLIDYTYGREHTFFTGGEEGLDHIDFTFPYSESVRQSLLSAAKTQQLAVLEQGVYAATQGPRLETSAEIHRLKRDGCTLVGMTGMPEAGLARELQLEYAAVCLVVNWGAGLSDDLVTLEIIRDNLAQGMGKVRALLAEYVLLGTS